jgi:hypothetical protein
MRSYAFRYQDIHLEREPLSCAPSDALPRHANESSAQVPRTLKSLSPPSGASSTIRAAALVPTVTASRDRS